MEKRKLGDTNLNLSVIGIGCWQFGGGSYWGEQSQDSVNKIVDKALDEGINYFDTAEFYNEGRSESSLGEAIQGKRNQAIIGSKVSPANANPGEITRGCEDSLKRLKTDCMDLYMLHWPLNSLSIKHHTNDQKKIDNPPRVEEVFYELDNLKKEGKIRYFGVSNFGNEQMDELKNQNIKIASNQLAYNLFSRAIEEEILPYCVRDQIGVISYSPLLQGVLTGKIDSAEQVIPERATSRHFHYSRGKGSRHGELGAENEINEALIKLKKISYDLEIPMSNLALSWIISNKDITSTIVGSRNIEQLMFNIQSTNFNLSQETIGRINKITKPVFDKLGKTPDYYENRNQARIF